MKYIRKSGDRMHRAGNQGLGAPHHGIASNELATGEGNSREWEHSHHEYRVRQRDSMDSRSDFGFPGESPFPCTQTFIFIMENLFPQLRGLRLVEASKV